MTTKKQTNPSVLIIDDDEEIRVTLREVLEDNGFRVDCAGNGREALELLLRNESNPALILLDLTMPEMDGRVFRQEQQKLPRLAQIPVVLFSGHVDASRVALAMNAAAVMTKPLRLDGLVTLVDQLANHRKPN